MWVLTTNKRQSLCQGVLEACAEQDMTSPLIVWMDYGNEYPGLRIPKNCVAVLKAKEWGSLGSALRAVLQDYPDEPFYAWLSDDTFPLTYHFDKELEASAGAWDVACARDLWVSENPESLREVVDGRNLTSGLVWGGKLVREVGWWMLPGSIQAGADLAWCEIINQAGLMRYRHDVIVEHYHYKANKRPVDESDSWVKDSANYVQKDIDNFYKKKDDGVFSAIAARVKKAKENDEIRSLDPAHTYPGVRRGPGVVP